MKKLSQGPKNEDFSFSTVDPNQNSDVLNGNFLRAVNKHAPLKKKLATGNQAPFMIRELQNQT